MLRPGPRDIALFIPAEYKFTYRVGNQSYAGTVKLAPSVIEQAITGDPYARKTVCEAIGSLLYFNHREFRTQVEWSKIKWEEPAPKETS